jgi:putative transposase
VRKSFKYRLKLTKKQAKLLQQMLDECRWLYNECLEQRILAYQELGESLSLVDQHAFLPFLKEERKSLEIQQLWVSANHLENSD